VRTLPAEVVDMTDGRAALGRWGEDVAAQHLAASGAQVLARNWRCREGEIDLVVRDPDGTLVFCEVKTRSAYTHMRIKASEKLLSLDVLYTDERIEKGPLVCVQLYFDGARTGETCDRKHRDPDERWQVGTVDMASGKLLEPAITTGTGAGADGGNAGNTDAGKTKKPLVVKQPIPKPPIPPKPLPSPKQ